MLRKVLAASCSRPCLIASVSQLPHRKDRFLSHEVHRWPRLQLEVRMVEMGRFMRRASPEVGVNGEADAMLGGEKSPDERRKAAWRSSMEAGLNQMSKWLLAGCLFFAALWKHDAESMWVFLGAIGNRILSKILKMMLNYERPTQALRSDPGMPSSHAQSIFYAATILILSLFHWLKTNYVAMVLVPPILSAAAYLSWLRVSQGLHTQNQVVVGAAVGSIFGTLWFKLWHSLVQEALPSSPFLRNAVVLVSAVFCIGYVIRHWLKHNK